MVMSRTLLQPPESQKIQNTPANTGKLAFQHFSGIPEKYAEHRFWPDFSRPPATFANTRKIPFQQVFDSCATRRHPRTRTPRLKFFKANARPRKTPNQATQPLGRDSRAPQKVPPGFFGLLPIVLVRSASLFPPGLPQGYPERASPKILIPEVA